VAAAAKKEGAKTKVLFSSHRRIRQDPIWFRGVNSIDFDQYDTLLVEKSVSFCAFGRIPLILMSVLIGDA